MLAELATDADAEGFIGRMAGIDSTIIRAAFGYWLGEPLITSGGRS